MTRDTKRVQDGADAVSDAIGKMHAELQQLDGRRMKVGERLSHLRSLAHALAQCTGTLARVAETSDFERRLADLEAQRNAPSGGILDGLDLAALTDDEKVTLRGLLDRARTTANPEGRSA